MLKIKAYHDSHDLNYRNPFGAVPKGMVVKLRIKITSNLPVAKCFLRLWLNDGQEKLIKMKPKSSKVIEGIVSEIFEKEYPLPEKAGLVWYYFIFTINDQDYYYGNNDEELGGVGKISTSPPFSYQITVYQPSPVPRWYKNGVMYQIFVDRFAKGEEQELTKDRKEGIARKNGLYHLNWYDTPFYIKDQEGRVIRWNFFGGNLVGVIEKLDYLQELGITIIYFNPIFEAASNHKYDTANYLKIDAMFGDEALFRELVAEAAARDIAIILDGVFSHTGCNSIYFNRYGHYDNLGAYQSSDSPYFNWYRFTGDGNTYECWWGVDDLPNVDEMEPSYREFIYGGKNSVIRHWSKAGVKGWRLDVADELPDTFIKELKQALRETEPEGVLIGEVWEDASRKISYGQLREYFWGEELDATMNYPLRIIFLDYILGRLDAFHVHQRVMSLYENYPRENFYAAMNLIGSHDRERVLTLLGEAPEGDKLTDAEKENYRLKPEARELAKKRLKLLTLLQMTFPGVPSIYYGDEAGMEGYRDPFNRGPYPWGFEDQELLIWHQRLIRLRREYPLFQEGNFKSYHLPSGVYGFSLEGEKEKIIVLVNPDQIKKRNVVFKFPDGPLILDLLAGKVLVDVDEIEIPPISGRLIYLKEKEYGAKTSQGQKSILPKGQGILLHITSLPGQWGVGDLGQEAYDFVDFLAATEQTIWQVLPLHPTGVGNSPYNSFSAFAGNDLLLDINVFADEGYLSDIEIEQVKQDYLSKLKPVIKADFDLARQVKNRLFQKAFYGFQANQGFLHKDYLDFVHKQKFWLNDYCLYTALKEYFHGAPWHLWDQAIAQREKETLDFYQKKLQNTIDYHYFLQYHFFRQWEKLKVYAHNKGVLILGDLPIYVAEDSCDTWVHRQFFSLDKTGRSYQVAGVPPDYFSDTGQLWGNPTYNWQQIAAEDYTWWIKRIKHNLEMYDYLRLDHFRGFEAYWAINAQEETAEKGIWLKGPGQRFFSVLENELGSLPVIVEDLGLITPEVNNLKHIFGFPGMQVYQFAAEEMLTAQFPLEADKNMVYYSGTHDNDTLAGWCVKERKPRDVVKILTRLYQKEAAWVIVPMQDILGLTSEARMNIPGTVYGNWEWRLGEDDLTETIKKQLKDLTTLRNASINKFL